MKKSSTSPPIACPVCIMALTSGSHAKACPNNPANVQAWKDIKSRAETVGVAHAVLGTSPVPAWPTRPDFHVNFPGERVTFTGDHAPGEPEKQVGYLVYDLETVRDEMFPVEFKEDGVTEKFPNAAQWQVVSACGLAVARDGTFLQPIVHGRGGEEEAIVWDLARVISELPGAQLVSWNGRSFDGPVLSARLFRYGWPSPLYMGHFRKRYFSDGPRTHLDLCDLLSDYGAGARAALDHYARLIGLPGKAYGDGGGVAALWAAGEREKIDLYCLTDVVQTAFVLLRYLVLSGDLTREAYQAVVPKNLELCRDVFGGAAVDESRLCLPSKNKKKGSVAA